MRPAYLMATGVVVAALVASTASAQINAPAPATAKPAPAAAKPAAAPAAKPAAAPASTASPSNRIGFVNTEAFGDEKAGIARYVAAIKSVDQEFEPRQKELVALQARVASLADEVTKLNAEGAAAATIQSKVDENQRLQVELKRLTEDAQAAYNKRTDELMNPIVQDISKALQQFATQRSLTMLLDISKMGSAILTMDPSADMTEAFIADFNRKNPAAR